MDILEEIAAAAEQLRNHTQIEARRNELIHQAWKERIPWKQIAQAAGISPQAAYNARQKHLNAMHTKNAG